jgi:hypothetical protein
VPIEISPIVGTLTRYNLALRDGDQDVGTVEVSADEDGILVRVRLDDDSYGVILDARMS